MKVSVITVLLTMGAMSGVSSSIGYSSHRLFNPTSAIEDMSKVLKGVASVAKLPTNLNEVSDMTKNFTSLLKMPAEIASSMANNISNDIFHVPTNQAEPVADESKVEHKAESTLESETSNKLTSILKMPSSIVESMSDISKDILKVSKDLAAVPQVASNVAATVAGLSKDMLKVQTDLTESVAGMSNDLLKVRTGIENTALNPRSAFADIALQSFFDVLRKVIVKSIAQG